MRAWHLFWKFLSRKKGSQAAIVSSVRSSDLFPRYPVLYCVLSSTFRDLRQLPSNLTSRSTHILLYLHNGTYRDPNVLTRFLRQQPYREKWHTNACSLSVSRPSATSRTSSPSWTVSLSRESSPRARPLPAFSSLRAP